ncbi:hypothetical protein GSI_07528 [Ganoderma sinense ZZ0214-1]|uniref:DUF4218 domain-containing protein n=1 Tax=Ganoderma sinense ZZ0214-1 TaxID=1077348 RepID=A0A2G8S9A2_9APHY|nr:hypothetical protein GSI_07528 [Ganoderma sinense ZZ0214-1]
MPERASTRARRQARYVTQEPEPDDVDDRLAQQVLAMTIADEGPDPNSQPNRLWMPRARFQRTRPLPEPASNAAISSVIMDTFQGMSETMSLPAAPPVPSTSPMASTSRISTRPTLSSSGEHVSLSSPPLPSRPPEEERPTRRARRTAAQKAIEDQLKAAALIHEDLRLCEEMSKRQPTLQLYYELRHGIRNIATAIDLLNRRDERVQTKRTELLARCTQLRQALAGWSQVVCLPTEAREVDTSCHFERPIDHHTELTQACGLLAMVCQVIMGISRRGGDFVMGMLTIILSFISNHLGDTGTNLPRQTLNQLPTTIETIASWFRLDGKLTVRAVCPRCHANYPPLDDASRYPSKCNNQSTPGSICDTPLLDSRGEPLKSVTMHSFEDYLGVLFANPVTEAYIMRPRDMTAPAPSIVKTPHDAEFLRNLKGHDGELFYAEKDAGREEARLTFALCVDFFATEGMHVRGPTTSLGIIALACLDLPIEIRYKPEYMFLFAIIPGPTEPSLTELNHYIDPLVTIMLESWVHGLRLTRTALKSEGRTARCGIALVVCDLPAARKTSQLAASTSMIFCSVCNCWDVRDHRGHIIREWRKLRGRYDYEQWQPRDIEVLRKAAADWRDAPSVSDQEKIFAVHGVRWSPLWRLPYWDPSRQLLHGAAVHSDPARPPAFVWEFAMPDVFEDADSHGAQDTDEVQEDIPDGMVDRDADAILEQTWSEKELKDLRSIHGALTAELCDEGEPAPGRGIRSPTALQSYLNKRLLRCLVYVQLDLQVDAVPSGNRTRVTKADIARSLVEWRMKHPRKSTRQVTKIITPSVFDKFHHVVKNTITPSWIGSVPYNFGEAAAGTPKADEWRTVFTIYLPITLLLLFGQPDSSPHLRAVLDHTMQLVCAVLLACKRTTNSSRMERYRLYLRTYIEKLPALYPDLGCESIHHMAFHIYDFLKLFGPVNSWWAFPFERLIGQLQRIPTNHKFGAYFTLAKCSE